MRCIGIIGAMESEVAGLKDKMVPLFSGTFCVKLD